MEVLEFSNEIQIWADNDNIDESIYFTREEGIIKITGFYDDGQETGIRIKDKEILKKIIEFLNKYI